MGPQKEEEAERLFLAVQTALPFLISYVDHALLALRLSVDEFDVEFVRCYSERNLVVEDASWDLNWRGPGTKVEILNVVMYQMIAMKVDSNRSLLPMTLCLVLGQRVEQNSC